MGKFGVEQRAPGGVLNGDGSRGEEFCTFGDIEELPELIDFGLSMS